MVVLFGFGAVGVPFVFADTNRFVAVVVLHFFQHFSQPYILPCNHNICLKCIDSLIDENKTLCPLCNSHFNKEERNTFQINLVFLNIL
ncbi:MAG: hypothetical protein IIU10_01425, partial [Paludibacteraceae bacterium]|nr:hypothetical protein [Paludibacteraceae bacterium]